jgi:hypothetical protein
MNQNLNLRLLAAGILLFLVSATFSVITPVFSGPDDDFHLGSIWCADGISQANCVSTSNDEYTTYGQVPNGLGDLLRCKSRVVSDAPNCTSLPDRSGYAQVRINDSAYPMGFYKFNNLLITSDVKQSIAKMRISNSILLLLALFVSFLILPLGSAVKMIVSSTILLLPFPLFFVGTNNPQVWSLTTIIPLYFVFSEAYRNLDTKHDTIQIIRYVFLIFVTGLFVSSRGDGMYILIFLLGVIALADLKNLNKERVIFAAIWTTSIMVVDKIYGADGMRLSSAKMQSDGNSFNLHNILELPGFALGMFGGRGDSGYLGLGSYDLPLPSLFWSSILFVLFTFLSISHKDRFRDMAFAVGIIGVFVISLYGMNQQAANTAGFFQPRYLLPFALIAILVKLERNLDHVSWTRVILTMVAQLLAFIVFLYAVVLRYSSGIQVENSKYLELFSLPNTYVSKSMINWGVFSGELNGLVTLPAGTVFVSLTILWFFNLIAVGSLIISHSRACSVSQR